MLRSKNLHQFRKLLKLRDEGNKFSQRWHCSKPDISSNHSEQKFVGFGQMISQRRNEASRSLVVQVSSENSYQELYYYCSQFGNIKSAFHYKIVEDQNHFILLEFENMSGYSEALNHSSLNEESPGIPVISPFMWFKIASKGTAKMTPTSSPPPLKMNNQQLSDTCLNEMLSEAADLDDQINILYHATCLNDLGIRLRFILGHQLETALSGMFPSVHVFPFGSSVNGMGKIGCDLDLIVRWNHNCQRPSNSRLIFHTKASLSNDRSQTQRQMETLGDILHLFLPGVNNVRRILQARVPIIKFNHECLDLEVDLSMSNLSGLYMSELFYLYGEIDHRVRPLTFCIRKWARATGLTNLSPGRWISNFSLTCLVIFFLQRLETPILPELNFLVKSATAADIRIANENINCTFLRDLNKLNFHSSNQDSLEHLLTKFFEFYSLFDFSNRAVSLNDGRPMMKADHSAMYIVNPFEPLLNVSKNVSLEELERFKFAVKNAAWVLDSKEKNADASTWGLLNLFKTNKHAQVRPQMFFKSRLVEVSDLFGASAEPQKTPVIDYKNENVKDQIQSIRRATKKQIEEFESMSKIRTRSRKS